MKYESLGQIRKEREDRMSALIKDTGVFFAFSNKQFEENKTPIAEGEKYASIGGGGYLPSKNKQAFRDGIDAIDAWYDAAVTESGFEDEEIVYELHNHECFYTGDPDPVIEMFEGRFDRERILKAFYSHVS